MRIVMESEVGKNCIAVRDLLVGKRVCGIGVVVGWCAGFCCGPVHFEGNDRGTIWLAALVQRLDAGNATENELVEVRSMAMITCN